MSESDEADNQPAESSRRSFIKQGLKGAALLPYVIPAVESVFLLTSSSEADADDDDSDSGGGGIPPSQLGNNPPPPGNSNDNDDDNSNSDSDSDDGRKYGEPR
ncbi:MAG: hypothetical protein HOE48_18090 [Candidatus Latescibacteria bacterium]|jgi:hypothetical protein|nr:hypothetical protein [Candidatus Latescibacterota bacterium]